jgi:hypothetical protein
MTDATILYVTANTESEAFEARIRSKLLAAAGGMPIVSVSQKPIDFGENICVGKRGASYANEYRQILIAAHAAKTEWVVAAEADFLYPPAYFSFEPPEGTDLWRYNNVWILWRAERYATGFRRKRNSEGAQWARREFLIERLEAVTKGLPKWHAPGVDWQAEVYLRGPWGPRIGFGLFGDPSQPAVSVKSGSGMRPTTRVARGPDDATPELPIWGAASALREELFHG